MKRGQAMAREGKLPGRRVGRKWLFDERDLEAALGRAGGKGVAVIKSTEVMIGKGTTPP